MSLPEVVSEFRRAVVDRHSYDPRNNSYLLFGLLWGLSLPALLLISHVTHTNHSLGVGELFKIFHEDGISYWLVAFLPLFALVFGTLGTIRRDKERDVERAVRQLDAKVTGRTRDLEEAKRQTVLALSRAIEAKDPYTHGHCYRVWKFAERAAQNLGVCNDSLDDLRYACYLHDIGKIRIPGAILNKSDGLTDEERAMVQLHPIYSQRIIGPIKRFSEVALLVRHHHERHDGSGYPDGLRGDQLPQLARILIVADALDAMCSDRPYRKAISAESAIEELRRCAGLAFDAQRLPGSARQGDQQFDPRVVAAMVEGLLEDPVEITLPPEGEIGIEEIPLGHPAQLPQLR